MSKRTIILVFISLAVAFIAYLSFKHDKENEVEPEEFEETDIETEPEETEPETKVVKPPKLKKVKDEPISEEKTDPPADVSTNVEG